MAIFVSVIRVATSRGISSHRAWKLRFRQRPTPYAPPPEQQIAGTHSALSNRGHQFGVLRELEGGTATPTQALLSLLSLVLSQCRIELRRRAAFFIHAVSSGS